MATLNPVPPTNAVPPPAGAVPPNQLNLGPQPDFDRLVQGAQQTADELGKLRNLPTFDQGQFIVDAINRLSTRFDTQFTRLNTQFGQLDTRFTQLDARFTQLNTQFDQLDTRFTQLNTRVTQNHNNVTQQITQLNQNMTQGFTDLRTGLAAAEHNAAARVANSRVNRRNHDLTVLHDSRTNTPVAGFPNTIGQLMNLHRAEIDNVLTALNLSTNGTVADKRQRLRLNIGLLDEAA